MRLVFVVLFPPLVDDLARLGRVDVLTQISYHIAHAAVEAFDVHILIRAIRLDVVNWLGAEEFPVALYPGLIACAGCPGLNKPRVRYFREMHL